MPINNFSNSSSNSSDNKIDTSLFVQKSYLRHNYIESNMEENIKMKNQYRLKNLPFPLSINEAASKDYVDGAIILGVNEALLLRLHPDIALKIFEINELDSILLDSTIISPRTTLEIPTKNYVDNKFNDPSIIKNTEHKDLNDRNITNARFIQVNQWPQIDSHLTPRLYVDNAVDESSLVRNNKDKDFNNNNLTNTNSITLNTQAVNNNHVNTKAYVDQFHQENERSRRDVGLDFYNESNDLVKNNQDNDLNDNNLTNIKSITINNNPTDDNHVSNKKYIDDELDKHTIVRFNQTLQNYLKVSVGNDTYNLTKYNKIQLTDTTTMKAGNTGGYLLPYWKIICNDKNNNGKKQNFIKSTETNSPTVDSGAMTLPPIGSVFMYIETSSSNHGHDRVFVSWERTDIIQITNITFYYNRFSILTNDSLKAMGRFRIQLLIEDDTWNTQYTIAKNTQNDTTSTEWTLLNLDFTVENYGIKLIYDQIDTAHADMCFSNITITHSVY